MRGMSLYAGCLIVYEPGRSAGPRPVRRTLGQMVELLREHAAGKGAWVVKVPGPITCGPNALVPSTRGALANENDKRRTAKRRAREGWLAGRARDGRIGFAFAGVGEVRKDEGMTGLYTDVIEAGVVAWSTRFIIQALPPAPRAEYEALEVEAVLFYPKKLVAADGPGYDALVERVRHGGTPWMADLDMGGPDGPVRHTVEWRFGEDHVALRFDLGRLAGDLQALREKAKADENTAGEKGCQEAVNSLYGVLASRHLPTKNVVAANVVTATARALAFALPLSLNGVQVITDGCTCRRDQVPAGTLADCLTASPSYPIDRAGSAGPHLDPSSIPEGGEFTGWYRGHVQRFFRVVGPEYDALFALHGLVHKRCGPDDTGSEASDALCCDGSANHLKLASDGAGGWKPAGGLKDSLKARSFKRDDKALILDWFVRTYSTDAYVGPPVTESKSLLAYKEAG